ncbi:MAG: hypothetical protein HFF44_01310 [Lawsonibacter sp.]|jgi:hypothetical protein|nr:hypothetical protein [Lawsonibacter sp.]
MKLYICSTYYHVYITLLKYFAAPFEGDLVICDDIPTGDVLAERVRAHGWFHNVWFVEQSGLPEERGKGPIDWAFFQHRRRAKRLKPLVPFDLDRYTDIYLYHDGTPLGMYLADVGRRYHLIEDSLDFYQSLYSSAQARCLHKRSWKYGIQRILNAGYFPLGESRLLIDVEVNDRNHLQIAGQTIIECPRDSLEQALTVEQKGSLLEIFGCDELEIGERTALILTEPLYQDGVVSTRETQKEVYRDMVASLREDGYSPVIKPHPRDETDYTDLGCQVGQRFFPIEMLALLGTKKIPCAAAVRSSGLKRLNTDQKRYFPIKKKETGL